MKFSVIVLSLAFIGQSLAYEVTLKKGESEPELETLLQKASSDTGIGFESEDFLMIEERELATSRFTMFVQMNSGVPVARTAVRIWKDLTSGKLILAELHLDERTQEQEELLKSRFKLARFSPRAMKSKQLSEAISLKVFSALKSYSDSRILSMKSKDQWENGDLVRLVEVRSRRGVHIIALSLLKNRVIRHDYREFLRIDYHSVRANIFPVYEEVELTGERLPFEVRELRYINSAVAEGGEYPFEGLGNKTYP